MLNDLIRSAFFGLTLTVILFVHILLYTQTDSMSCFFKNVFKYLYCYISKCR